MLNSWLLKRENYNFYKNNLYLDYYLRRICKWVVVNILTWFAIFILEKFVIEYTALYLFNKFYEQKIQIIKFKYYHWIVFLFIQLYLLILL